MADRRQLENRGVNLAVRLAIAAPFATLGMIVLVKGAWAGGFATAGALILATACFLVAGIALAPWVAEAVATPAGNLFFPDRKYSRAQPRYSIPEGHRARCEFQAAMDAYEAILVEFPGDARCFIALMDIAVTELHDAALAEGIYRRACGEVVGGTDRHRLDEAHAEILRDYR
ncbi:MAG: hypothetical protein JXR77_19265 [Lentisphaeria bacterium]|nr:hypothetical protein [Lentisphaeria bacterium]